MLLMASAISGVGDPGYDVTTLVPDSITRTMTDFTKDPRQLLQRRRQLADMIEQLAATVRDND